MTLMLELPPDLATSAREQADQAGQSLQEYVLGLVREAAEQHRDAVKPGRTQPRVMGSACGLIKLAPDFFAPLPSEVEEAFWS